MTTQKIFSFSNKNTNNSVEFEKDGDIVWITHYNVDEDNGKLFVLLLRESFDKMKKLGCKYHNQCIGVEEWDTHISAIKHWTVIEKLEDKIIIQTPIDYAATCIITGFVGDLESFGE